MPRFAEQEWVVLHEAVVKPILRKPARVPGFRELAAGIGEARRCNKQDARDREIFDDRAHAYTPSAMSLSTRPSSVLPRSLARARSWLTSI